MTVRETTQAACERSEYAVPRMDCPSEEQAIRLALESSGPVRRLSFDLPGRRLVVWHALGAEPFVTERLQPLGFGAELLETRTDEVASSGTDALESRTLRLLLAINAAMFVVELGAGLTFQSTGLLADSLDMLADAAVYGLSLYAVGRAASRKLRAARVSGALQLALAVAALGQVAYRLLFGSEPEPMWMVGVSAVALLANVTCLALIWRHREGGAHMRASYIFSTNDVLANLGVIVAGLLVALTSSNIPDLLVGGAIGVLVLTGAIRILRL